MSYLPSIDEIDQALEAIKKAGDAKLPECGLISPAMRQIPPQRAGVAHILFRPRFVLADPTGCGKTPTTLAAFAYIKQKQPRAKLWVFAKRSAQDQWGDSARLFLPSLRTEVLGFDPRKPNTERDIVFRRLQYRRFQEGDIDILVSTYQMPAQDLSLARVVEDRKGRKKRLHTPQPPQIPYLMVAFDEAHFLRGHTSKLYWPFHRQLSSQAARVVGLTATPLMGSLDDIYAIYEAIRPGTFDGDYSRFQERFYRYVLVPRKDGKGRFRKIIGVQNIAMLRDMIVRFIIQRPVADFDKFLPPVTFQYRMVELEPGQRHAYDALLKQVIPPLVDTGYKTAQRLAGKLAEGDATITTQIGALSYLQMVVDAPECLGLDKLPSAKAAELIDYLEHSAPTEKVIIFTRYEQVATALVARLAAAGIVTDRITGKESGPQRTATRKRFQEGDLRVLLITSAGSESQDLQAAKIVVLYDLPWSWGEFLQVIGRARRIGSTADRIQVLLLGAARTLDTHTLAILRRKEKLSLETGLSVSDLTLARADDSILIDDSATSAIVSRSLAADLFTAVANDLTGSGEVSPLDVPSQNPPSA